MNNGQFRIQQLAYKAIDNNVEARNKLIDHYTKFVIKEIETKYNDQDLNKKDLIQAGIDGIIHAIEIYNKNLKTHFSVYVKSIINNSLIKEARIQQNINTFSNTSQYLVIKMIKGDSNAKDDLIDYYIKQIIRLIETKYNNVNCDKEDLIQAGCLGLIISINNYKETYNSTFSAIVYGNINYFINKEIEKKNEYLNNKYNNLSTDDLYHDFISDIENKELIEKGFKKLSNRYQEILILCLYGNYSYEQIGKMYNVRRQRIDQIYKRSIEIIKEEITEKKQIKNKQKIVK